MASKKNDDRKNVVVVGGGYSGIPIASHLSKTLDPALYNVILINPVAHYVHRLALPRLVVSSREGEELEKISWIPYDKIFAPGRGTFTQGKVVSVLSSADKKSGEVTLESGEVIPYAILVLATGSTWNGPVGLPDDADEARKFVREYREKFAKAGKVLIVGAGAVGLELAGEIKDVYPEKGVTVIHSQDHPLNDTYSLSFRQRLESSFKARGVEFVFNDAVEFPAEPGTVTTKKGAEITADLVVDSRGASPSTSYLTSLYSSALTASGQIAVRPTLQLKEYDHIFAAGDILDWKEQKQAAKTANHAAVVGANVVAYLQGTTPSKLYKGSTELIVLTNGKNGGSSWFNILWGIQLGDWFTRLVKSRTLLVPAQRQALGYA